MTKLSAIVLAAGQGTRMKSARAKVLFGVCGRPMLHYVLDAVFEAGAVDAVVVLGFDRVNVEASLAPYSGRVRIAYQDEQRGTGHAVMCALPQLDSECDRAFVVCGDTPLVQGEELAPLSAALGDAPMALLTCAVPDPTGYGRILRDAAGRVMAIREQKDLDASQSDNREVNPAMYLVRTQFLRSELPQLRPENRAGELYFTDLVAIAAERGGARSVTAHDPALLVGCNDRSQVADAERLVYERRCQLLAKAGVTVRGAPRVDHLVKVEADVILEDGVHLRGHTVIARGAHIDVGCIIEDSEIGASTTVLPYTVISRSKVGANAKLGPFSHIRPESDIGDDAHVGNFVETKKTRLRRGAKANHLAYLGDGDIGEGANIGAGTIFCNYDGFRKHRTVIGKQAFIGSDSQLVAPVTVGDGAYVGTGTTVTRDVPADALAIGRTKQENKEGYASRLRTRLKAGKE